MFYSEGNMKISYKKLWKLLIDRDMMKKDLAEKAGISNAQLQNLEGMKMLIQTYCLRYV